MQPSKPIQLDWDTEIDTPATVLVVGGGPVGVEAGLYARFLGYSVVLAERYRVGSLLACWSEHPMSSSWRELTSSLGLAALEAQGKDRPGEPDQVPTHRQFVDEYLVPVAKTDLLYDSVQIGTSARSISRIGCPPVSKLPINVKAEREFRALLSSRQRGDYSQIVDLILDCSGLGWRAGLATGGGQAAGETSLAASTSSSESPATFHEGKVDLQRFKSDFVGQHTLVFGNGLEAFHNVHDLRRLCEEHSGTRVSWLFPKQAGQSKLALPEGLDQQLEHELTKQFEDLRAQSQPNPMFMEVRGIEAIQPVELDHYRLQIQSKPDETLDLECDRFINCASCFADWQIAKPMGVMRTEGHITSEPHYYVLGQKSFEDSYCTLADCRQQIRDVFALIGGRAELNLYETFRPKSG